MSATGLVDAEAETSGQRVPEARDHALKGQQRPAAWVFGIYVAVALPVIVLVLGTYHWFLGDDWDFLSMRSGTSFEDLMRPHAEHLSTLPILLYRVEWRLFGLRYTGYQALVVIFHLAAAVLLRAIMRRAGVHPWIATAAAAIFVLFGPGFQNILWSFQIGMTGSLAFGLVHLLAAGHDERRILRRDWFGLLAGLAAVASSSPGVIMVAVVGLSLLLRRHLIRALLHTVALAALYVVWFVAYRGDQPPSAGHISASDLAQWLRQAFVATFEALGAGRVLGLVIAVVTVVGIALAIHRRGADGFLRSAADPIALAVGAVAFQSLTANARWAFGLSGGRASRYLHVTALLLLPLVALGFDAVASRWRRSTIVLVVVLLLPIPGNIQAFTPSGSAFSEDYFDRERTTVEAIAWSKLATKVPSGSQPIRDILGGEGPPVGWLVDARRAGKVPEPEKVPPQIADELRVRLGVRQTFPTPAQRQRARTCRTYRQPIDLDPRLGTSFILRTDMGVRLRNALRPTFFASPFKVLAGSELTVELQGLHLSFGPLAPATSFVLCR